MRHNACGNEWMVYPDGFTTRQVRCPKCCVRSKGELKIKKFLEANCLEYDVEFKIAKSRKRFDFRVGNILIEFDGMQHFTENSHNDRNKWGGCSTLSQRSESDKLKTEMALLHGYKILRISYSELKNVDIILKTVLILGYKDFDMALYGKEYLDRRY